MSKSNQRRMDAQGSVENSTRLFAQIEQEMADGYLEVETTGISAKQLLCVYGVMFRSAYMQAVGNIRSLMRVTAAH